MLEPHHVEAATSQLVLERRTHGRGVPLAGEHCDHGAKDGARGFRIEEEVAELRRVEADHEATEGLVPPPLPFREARELPRGEVVLR